MRHLRLLTILLLLTGCAESKYYSTVQSINQSVTQSNADIAKACADGLNNATNESSRLAIALTTCQKQQMVVQVAPPESKASIIRALLSGLPFIGYFFDREARTPTHYEYNVGGNYKYVGRDETKVTDIYTVPSE